MFLASRYRLVLEVVPGAGGITCAPFPVFPAAPPFPFAPLYFVHPCDIIRAFPLAEQV